MIVVLACLGGFVLALLSAVVLAWASQGLDP